MIYLPAIFPSPERIQKDCPRCGVLLVMKLEKGAPYGAIQYYMEKIAYLANNHRCLVAGEKLTNHKDI